MMGTKGGGDDRATVEGILVSEYEQLTSFANRGAELLQKGHLVAVPTDTQYALSALGSHGPAIMQCFSLKNRADDDPMPIFIPDLSWLDVVADGITPEIRTLAESAWPGALTLLLRRQEKWRSLAAPGKTVALRIPNHPLALNLLAAVGAPITGSSANRHGDPAALNPESVYEIFGDDVTVLPTLGVVPQGTPSTILDCSDAVPKIIRSGAVEDQLITELIASHLKVVSK